MFRDYRDLHGISQVLAWVLDQAGPVGSKFKGGYALRQSPEHVGLAYGERVASMLLGEVLLAVKSWLISKWLATVLLLASHTC